MYIEFIKAHFSGIVKGHIVKVDKVFGERMIKEKFAKESNEDDCNIYNEILREEITKNAPKVGEAINEELTEVPLEKDGSGKL